MKSPSPRKRGDKGTLEAKQGWGEGPRESHFSARDFLRRGRAGLYFSELLETPAQAHD